MELRYTINDCAQLLHINDNLRAIELAEFLAEELHIDWRFGDEAYVEAAENSESGSYANSVVCFRRAGFVFVLAHSHNVVPNVRGTGEFTAARVVYHEGQSLNEVPVCNVLPLGFFNDEGSAIAAFVDAIQNGVR